MNSLFFELTSSLAILNTSLMNSWTLQRRPQILRHVTIIRVSVGFEKKWEPFCFKVVEYFAYIFFLSDIQQLYFCQVCRGQETFEWFNPLFSLLTPPNLGGSRISVYLYHFSGCREVTHHFGTSSLKLAERDVLLTILCMRKLKLLGKKKIGETIHWKHSLQDPALISCYYV